LSEYRLSYDDTPPSFNAVGHSGNRWAWTKAKKTWQKTMEDLLQVAGVPRGLGKVEARAVLTFTRRGRRDVVNFRTLLEKCLGDALVNGGWLDDDTPDEFSFGAIAFEVGPQKKTELILVTPPRCKERDQVSNPSRPSQASPAAPSTPPRRFRRPPRG
jgi:hypothetical protein